MSYAHYKNIHSSLLRFVSDFAEEHGLEKVNLDAHTEAKDWPDESFIGVGEVIVDVEELYRVSCAFGLSTVSDPNHYRLSNLVQKLSAKLIPNRTLPIYDAVTGARIGSFYTLKGTRIGAPLKTEYRPVQPIFVTMETDLRSFAGS